MAIGKTSGEGAWRKMLSWVCSLTLLLSMACPNASALAVAIDSDTGSAATEVAAAQDERGVSSADVPGSEVATGGDTESGMASGDLVAVDVARQAEEAGVDAVIADATASRVWDGTTHDVSWYNTTDTTFVLTTAAQLAGLADITSPKNDYEAWSNGSRESRAAGITQDNFAGKTIKLGADIDLNNKQFDPISDFNNWGGGGQGVGGGTYSEVAWKGTFDGAGHTVKNLNIDGSINCSQNFGGYQGLISAIGRGGVVKTLGVTGQVVARVGGGIVGCSNTDEASETSATTTMTLAEWPKIMNCWADVDIEGNGSGSRGCGGIFGGESEYRAACCIINCYARGDVSNGTIGQAGGVSGSTNGFVTGCYNTGDVSGAYVGSITSTLFTNKCDEATYKGIGIFANNMARKGTGENVYRYTDSKNGTPVAVTEGFYSVDEIKAGAANLGGAYVAAPSSDVNGGYPVLFWQAGGSYLDISGATIGAIEVQKYSGREIEPPLSVTVDGKQLSEGLDYYVVYGDNIQPGDNTAKATAYGIGRYEGKTATATFSISRLDLSTCAIDAIPTTWSYGADEPATPALVVKNSDGEVLTAGSDYVVEYSDNVATGTATATVKGPNEGVSGSISATFNVVAAADSVKGSGSADDPYQVGSKGDLQFIAHRIYVGDEAYINGDIKITADIDATASSERDLAAEPLGAQYSYKDADGKSVRAYNHFLGSIDGGGHTIRLGLTASGTECKALVAYAGASSASTADKTKAITYKNLTIAGSVNAKYAAGLLCAQYNNPLVIENCVNKASLSSASGSYLGGLVAQSIGSITVKNSRNEGTIENGSTSGRAAGIVAYHNSTGMADTGSITIEGCTNAGEINSAGTAAGMLAQDQCQSPMVIKNCANTASIAGTGAYQGAAGIVAGTAAYGGKASLLVDSCYNSASVKGIAAGGISVTVPYAGASFVNCYNSGDISSTDTSANTNYGAGGILAVDLIGSSAVAGRGVTISGYNCGTIAGQNAGGAVGVLKSQSRNAATRTTWNISTDFLDTSATAGIGANKSSATDTSKLNDGTVGYAADDLKALPASLGSAFVKDDGAVQLNGGFPILYWQAGASSIDLSDATADAIADQSYTGSEVKPAVTGVTVGGKVLAENSDYVLSYSDNIKAGKATVTVGGIGLYSGTKTITFNIKAKDISEASVAAIPDLWTSSSIPATPALTVNGAGAKLVEGTDYSVSYKNNTATGVATATLTGLGNWGGTADVTYNVFATTTDTLQGSGTTADPYLVSSKDDLELVALSVNYAKGEYGVASIKLAADIDATAADGRPAVDSIGTLGKTPTATAADHAFRGTFDGAGHKVTLSAPLFGALQDAEVSNVTTDGTVSGSELEGALAGMTFGATSIVDCTNNAQVTTSGSIPAAGLVAVVGAGSQLSVSGCTNNSSVTSAREAGGIIGYIGNSAVVSVDNCLNSADVTSAAAANSYGAAAGIVGRVCAGSTPVELSISKCGNAGAIDGVLSAGILGLVDSSSHNVNATIIDAYNTGSVNSKSTMNKYAYIGTGGIVAKFASNGKNDTLTIKNAYTACIPTFASTNTNVGTMVGILQQSMKATLDNCYYVTSKMASIGSCKSENLVTDNSRSVSDEALKATGASGMAAKLGVSFADDEALANGGYPVFAQKQAAPGFAVPVIKKQAYTGLALKPAITVYSCSDTSTALVEGTDYVLAYSDNVAVGTASVDVVGIGAYEGVFRHTTFEIAQASLSGLLVDAIDSQVATGDAIEPEISITNAAGVKLTAGTDYVVAYSNNVNIGIATYVVVGKGNYTGAITGTFQIVGKSLEKAEVAAADVYYTGSDVAADVAAGITVTDADDKLVQGVDYAVSFVDGEGNPVDSIIDKGAYKAVIAGIGSYSGKAEVSFTVKAYLTVYKIIDDGEKTAVAEFTQDDLTDMASDSTVSALYCKKGTWNVSTGTSNVALSKLFNRAGLSSAYAEGASVEFASGTFSMSQTYEQLEGGKFYPATTTGAIDESLTGKTVSAVLALEEASSAIAEGETAADAEQANAAAATATTAPRILTGAMEDEYKASSAAGKRLVSNVDSITIKYETPSFNVQVLYAGSDTPKVVKSYKEKDLWDIRSEGDPISGMFWKGDSWRVVTSAEYVTFDDLFADAGVGTYWTSGATLMWGGDDPSAPQKAAQSMTYDEIVSRCYFFPKASGGNSDYPEINEAAPPVLTLTEYSVATGTTEAPTAADAVEYNIANKGVKNYPRVIWGITMDDYTGDHAKARGMYYWSNNTYLTIKTDQPDPDVKSIEDAKVEVPSATADGTDLAETIASGITVTTADGATLVRGTDYTVSFADAAGRAVDAITAAGTYKAIITGAGNYTGTVSASFTVQESVVADVVKRLAGGSRYETASKISSEAFEKSENVIIATGDNFPDALSASALAGALECPVLLTAGDALPEAAIGEIERLGAMHAYVLGGTTAVSDDVIAALAKAGVKVDRIAGDTRQDTANQVSEVVTEVVTPTTAIVASGFSPWDALSVSPYSYAKCAPIFLTEGDGTLSADTVAAIKSAGVTRVIMVGGSGVVSDSVPDQLAGVQVERWSGIDRYATCADIVKHELAEGMTISHAAVATGEMFPDALVGSALCGSFGGVMLMTDGSDTSLFDSIIGAQKSDVSMLYLLGGESVISTEFEKHAKEALS